jgi:putative transposase
MPRVGRVAPGGVIYHVLNRGNGRKQLFLKDGDYAAFLKLLAEVKEAVPVRVLAYCLMPNHWFSGLGRMEICRSSCSG